MRNSRFQNVCFQKDRRHPNIKIKLQIRALQVPRSCDVKYVSWLQESRVAWTHIYTPPPSGADNPTHTSGVLLPSHYACRVIQCTEKNIFQSKFSVIKSTWAGACLSKFLNLEVSLISICSTRWTKRVLRSEKRNEMFEILVNEGSGEHPPPPFPHLPPRGLAVWPSYGAFLI